MASNDYIERLKQVIFHLHGTDSKHIESAPVHEIFRGQTAWKGMVGVFELSGHPKAKRCYGWTFGEPEEFITILELPPVDSTESTVKVGIAYQAKRAGK